jgi:hypothetical protein
MSILGTCRKGGQDVYDCLMRKMMSILLLFGDADISKQGFTSGSHGVVAGTVRWIALEDVFALKKACFGLQRLARDKAEVLCAATCHVHAPLLLAV